MNEKVSNEAEKPALNKGAVSSLFKISTAWDCIKTLFFYKYKLKLIYIK